jgi:hypothetical protein
MSKAKEGNTWSNSKVEEALSALWLIAALLSWHIDFTTLAWILFVKSFLDTATSIIYAIEEKPSRDE